MEIKEKHSKKLLVEGNEDQHVIWALSETHGLAETFDVIDCKGIDNLIKQIPVRFKGSGVDTVGIIIDADVDLNGRWESVKQILTELGFTVPDVLPRTGLIVEHGNRKVGVWIMPDNCTGGMLEDFVSFLVPEDDKLLPVVHATLSDIESQQLNKYKHIHKSKAVIHTWLAWQEDPGTPMGLSITKRYLSANESTCQNLINWLKELF